MSELDHKVVNGKIVLVPKKTAEEELYNKICTAINKIERSLGLKTTDWGRDDEGSSS